MDSPEQQPELTPAAPEIAAPPAPTDKPEKPLTPAQIAWRTRREYLPPPGSLPITMADVPALDASALDPVVPPTKVVLRAVKTLGLPKSRWDKAKLMAIQQLGRYMSMKITARVLLVSSFDSLEQIENAYKVAAEIANDPKRSSEDRLTAVGMIAKITEAYAKFSDQMMTLAEKSTPAQKTLERPKNLPPTFAIQFNNAPATAAANSGDRPLIEDSNPAKEQD